ncbi:MAG: substrate-binding domain-containing protein [Cytophagales bacterium]|nr:substrate-binding domain-containing protein [Cytophagales bacterium]MDW8384042.1 substrate-binding domain-containing protein [Flammeovirgaceae bacterium]
MKTKGIIFLLGLGIVSCSFLGNNTKNSYIFGTLEDAQKLRIAIVPKGSSHIFWRGIYSGAQEAASQYNVELLWRSPLKEDDIQMQIAQIEHLREEGFHGLIVSPLDKHELNDLLASVTNAQKPLVILDSDIDNPHLYKSFVATDNYNSGKICAEKLAEALQRKGTVLVVRYMEGSGSTLKREIGFIETMQQIAPDIKLVGIDKFSGGSLESAFHYSQELLYEYPDISGIFASNEPTTQGMLRALQMQGKASKVKFIGFDANESLVHAVEDGEILALAVQEPHQMGYRAVETMVKILRGEEVSKEVVTNVKLITKDNLEDKVIIKYLKPTIDIHHN